MADRRCPHERIQYCPLFVAAHTAGLPTCVRDMDGPCEVERGRKDYLALIAALRVEAPDLVVDCYAAEQDAETETFLAGFETRGELH